LNDYLIVYRPPRATFVEDITEQEAAVIGEHFEYLKTLLAEGALLIAGRTEDAVMGLAVFRAADDTMADEIIRNDPAVKGGVFTATLYPYRVALFAGKN
jgi:uncharacterized protein YciI